MRAKAIGVTDGAAVEVLLAAAAAAGAGCLSDAPIAEPSVACRKRKYSL